MDNGHNEYHDNIYRDDDDNEFDYNQIELLLTEQKYEIGAITLAMQAIMDSLPKESAIAEQQKQLLVIQKLLINLDSSIGQNNTDINKFRQETNNKLKVIQQENEESQKQNKNIKHQLDQQKKILDDHLSLKFMAVQYISIAFLSSFMTVMALKTFLPTQQLSSPINTELQKANPNRSGSKPKTNKP
jgi:hypothetical protein